MFQLLDEIRRRTGDVLDVAGFRADETPHRVIAEFEGARVRSYQAIGSIRGPVLLIVAAPFKAPYIWDLMPPVSVVRRCLASGIQVYLLEWTTPGADEDRLGLDDYAGRLIEAAVATVRAETGCSGLILSGHSLGGTFAAIYVSLHANRVRGLALIDAPLSFGEEGDPLSHAIAAIPNAPSPRIIFGSPVPGSAINLLSALAAPNVYLGQPIADFAGSLFDPVAMVIHAHVRRWMLDEFPIPGRLFDDIVELLYRNNRFMHGSLEIGGKPTGVERLQGRLLAVVNSAGGIVPPMSIHAALNKVGPRMSRQVLAYQGGHGPALQHLGPLVAPRAHQRLWPEIIRWITAP